MKGHGPILHNLQAGKLNKFLCLGAAVVLLLFSAFAVRIPVYADDAAHYSLALTPAWGEGGLTEGRTYVVTLAAESAQDPMPSGESVRTLSETDTADPYEFSYSAPGDYWYTLSVSRKGAVSPLTLYYLHVRYDSGGSLAAAGALRQGSRAAEKTEFHPQDQSQVPSSGTKVTPAAQKTGITPAKKTSSGAKTGDTGNEELYIILAVSSVILIVLLAEKRYH